MLSLRQSYTDLQMYESSRINDILSKIQFSFPKVSEEEIVRERIHYICEESIQNMKKKVKWSECLVNTKQTYSPDEYDRTICFIDKRLSCLPKDVLREGIYGYNEWFDECKRNGAISSQTLFLPLVKTKNTNYTIRSQRLSFIR